MTQRLEEEEYYEEIWSWFDYFLRKRGRTSRLHLPVEDLKPYCHEKINDEYEFTDKPVQTHPPGYREICSMCLSEWVDND